MEIFQHKCSCYCILLACWSTERHFHIFLSDVNLDDFRLIEKKLILLKKTQPEDINIILCFSLYLILLSV